MFSHDGTSKASGGGADRRPAPFVDDNSDDPRPDISNFAGNVHGGLLLKYLDQVAYTCATR
jgi:hypothetical protein